MVSLGIFFRSDLRSESAGKDLTEIVEGDLDPYVMPYYVGFDIAVLSDPEKDQTLFLRCSDKTIPILGNNEPGDIVGFSFDEPME